MRCIRIFPYTHASYSCKYNSPSLSALNEKRIARISCSRNFFCFRFATIHRTWNDFENRLRANAGGWSFRMQVSAMKFFRDNSHTVGHSPNGTTGGGNAGDGNLSLARWMGLSKKMSQIYRRSERPVELIFMRFITSWPGRSRKWSRQ